MRIFKARFRCIPPATIAILHCLDSLGAAIKSLCVIIDWYVRGFEPLLEFSGDALSCGTRQAIDWPVLNSWFPIKIPPSWCRRLSIRNYARRNRLFFRVGIRSPVDQKNNKCQGKQHPASKRDHLQLTAATFMNINFLVYYDGKTFAHIGHDFLFSNNSSLRISRLNSHFVLWHQVLHLHLRSC